MIRAMQNRVTEIRYDSQKKYADPFNEIEFSAEITDPDGTLKTYPGFWAGGQTWKIRYSSDKIGTHHVRSVCSDMSNKKLHAVENDVAVVKYSGNNPLFRHGQIKVSENKRYFMHSDNTPFLWLGDTWWMALCDRLKWPEEYNTLVFDRAKKGFSVIQLVAGLYPDMIPFDERGKNEAGFPWDKTFEHINPGYFDMADRRIETLAEAGLVPCILGCWGYYIEIAGRDVLNKHWRYICARYGAYPVIWCMAGEALMPFYASVNWTREKNEKYGKIWSDREKRLEYETWARKEWTAVTEDLRKYDSYNRLITIHSTDYGHRTLDDPCLMDADMLQSGHGGWNSISKAVNMIGEALAHEPKMPVIEDEACYEGIGGSCHEDVQRFLFWASMLSGAAGYTYGADGIWQINRRDGLFGASPYGVIWGITPWDEAYKKSGSEHLGKSKEFLSHYEWWDFKPHADWCENHSSPGNRLSYYAAGVKNKIRMIYIPFNLQRPVVTNLEKNIEYKAFYFDPSSGDKHDLGIAAGDKDGNWMPGRPLPVFTDMLLVLESGDEALK